tara:strand:- start:261 stop:485 length:225 start_codon:yes stop_codon:yes gene_type:complete
MTFKNLLSVRSSASFFYFKSVFVALLKKIIVSLISAIAGLIWVFLTISTMFLILPLALSLLWLTIVLVKAEQWI